MMKISCSILGPLTRMQLSMAMPMEDTNKGSSGRKLLEEEDDDFD